MLTLECCISERGALASGRGFDFRAPAASAEALAGLAVDWVTLATNHTLDFRPNALLDSIAHLESAAAARSRLEAGATLIAGYSAHLFHGLDCRVLHELGDFLDDYLVVDAKLRNDLALLFLVDLDGIRLEAIPLKLEFAHRRLAEMDSEAWRLLMEDLLNRTTLLSRGSRDRR